MLEASDERGPFTVVDSSMETGFELVSVEPDTVLSKGKYYAIGLEWPDGTTFAYVATSLERHAFPYGYQLGALEGAEPRSASPDPSRRLRAELTFHDVVDDSFTCDGARSRCAFATLDDTLELRALSATQWQAFCDRFPSALAQCPGDIPAMLGKTTAVQCDSYASLDFSACAVTVADSLACLTDASDLCADFEPCLPEACPIVAR